MSEQRRIRQEARALEGSGFELDPETGWYERAVDFGGRMVTIRANAKPDLIRNAVECAEAFLRHPDALREAVEELKRQEGHHLGREEELSGIRVEAVDFFNPKRPTVGEVSFSEESGGEAWTCLFENGRFFDLSADS